MITHKKRAGHIILLLWIIYYAQGPIFGNGAMIGKILAVGLLALAFYHFYQIHTSGYVPRALKALDALVILFTIYGLYNLVRGDITGSLPSYAYLKSYYVSLLPIYSFYFYSKKGSYSAKSLRFFFLVLLVAFIALFYYNQMNATTSLDVEETTNNVGYEFVSLIPMLFLFKEKRVWQMLIAALLVFFVLSGFKRGAILVAALSLVLFFYNSFISSRGNSRIGILIISIVVVGFGAFYVGDLLESSDYFAMRVDETLEGNTSNRDIIYGGIINYFLHEASVIQLFFGGGADFSFKIVHAYAHNDWLQFLSDTGLFGCIMYLNYYIALFRSSRKIRRLNSTAYPVLLFVIFQTLMISFFSMSLIGLMIPYQLMIGYCLASPYLSKQYENNSQMLNSMTK